MASATHRHQSLSQISRRTSLDKRDEITIQKDYYIGIDIGTGSARACIIDREGDIVGLASENIGLWQPELGYYVGFIYFHPRSSNANGCQEQSTDDIWRCICICVQRAINQHDLDPNSIRGIGFDATCSLCVFSHDTNEPISVTGPDFNSDHNVILWLDHRPLEETEKVNSTGHNVLRYVGGRMSVEMEIPKVLWLKNHMPKDLFARCQFFDLADALTHIATGNQKRSFCSTVCKQGYIPVGVDGSVKGWQPEFLEEIGLGDLTKDNFKCIGGINGDVSPKITPTDNLIHSPNIQNGEYLSAGELVGTLCKKAANDLGIPEGIAIGSGVIDAYAGWIGTVGAKVQLEQEQLRSDAANNHQSQAFTRLAAVAGTSTCHLVMSPDPIFVPGVWGPYRDTIAPGFWMAEGGQSATGELLKYIIETHPAFHHAISVAESYDINIYQYLNEHLREMAVDQRAPSISFLGRHIFFYGDLFGNRSPIADKQMKGSIIGLSNDKSVSGLALLYYATLEFIALQTKHIVETMNSAGHRISSIFMSGSQCQNDILMHLIASACHMPVLIPRYVHAAVCHGAAMLGAKAASADKNGQTDDLWDIMDRMSKPGKTIHPSVDRHELALLSVKYSVFLEQCYKQQEYRNKVDNAIGTWGF